MEFLLRDGLDGSKFLVYKWYLLRLEAIVVLVYKLVYQWYFLTFRCH